MSRQVRHSRGWWLRATALADPVLARRAAERRTYLLAAVFALAALAACGGKSDSLGRRVDGTQVTATGLSVSPSTTMLKVNQTEAFTATAMMSSGPAQPVQPAWSSDNTTVLTIDGNGLARGVANGTATITATHQGVSEARRLRVVTDYQGSWAGDYIVRTCRDSGDFGRIDFCQAGEGFWPGDQLPIGLTLTQDHDQVQGPLALGDLSGTLRGSVNEAGELSATAALTLTAEGVVITFNVPALTVRADGDRLTGAFSVDVTAAGMSGQGHLDADLHSVARTAAVTAPARLGHSSSFGSWRELLRAAKGRR